jgi:hypothetical protein
MRRTFVIGQNPHCYERFVKQPPKAARHKSVTRQALRMMFCRRIPKYAVKSLADESFLHRAAFCESAAQMFDCLLTLR